MIFRNKRERGETERTREFKMQFQVFFFFFFFLNFFFFKNTYFDPNWIDSGLFRHVLDQIGLYRAKSKSGKKKITMDTRAIALTVARCGCACQVQAHPCFPATKYMWIDPF